MTYRHLCHGFCLSLGRALELLWTLNDQLLFGSFASPPLHYEQQLGNTVKLDPKETPTANISGEEESRESLVWKSLSLYFESCFLRMLRLCGSRGRTPSLKRLPLLHSVVLLGGVKHPHTRARAHVRTHNKAIWLHTIHLHGDTGPTKANKRWTFLLYYSLVRDSTPCVDSWNKKGLEFHQKEPTNNRTLKSRACCKRTTKAWSERRLISGWTEVSYENIEDNLACQHQTAAETTQRHSEGLRNALRRASHKSSHNVTDSKWVTHVFIAGQITHWDRGTDYKL